MCIRGQDSCVVCVQFAVYQVIVLGMHRSLLHMHIALRQVADARQGSTFAQQSTPYRFRCSIRETLLSSKIKSSLFMKIIHSRGKHRRALLLNDCTTTYRFLSFLDLIFNIFFLMIYFHPLISIYWTRLNLWIYVVCKYIYRL